eukprot:SAG31_NODE_16053_length_725_cov_1.143770_1_plen_67_part_10
MAATTSQSSGFKRAAMQNGWWTLHAVRSLRLLGTYFHWLQQVAMKSACLDSWVPFGIDLFVLLNCLE